MNNTKDNKAFSIRDIVFIKNYHFGLEPIDITSIQIGILSQDRQQITRFVSPKITVVEKLNGIETAEKDGNKCKVCLYSENGRATEEIRNIRDSHPTRGINPFNKIIDYNVEHEDVFRIRQSQSTDEKLPIEDIYKAVDDLASLSPSIVSKWVFDSRLEKETEIKRRNRPVTNITHVYKRILNDLHGVPDKTI